MGIIMERHSLNLENTIIAPVLILVFAMLLVSAITIFAGLCRHAFFRLKRFRTSPAPSGLRFAAVFNAVIEEAKRFSFKGLLLVLFENPREGILVFICMLLVGFGIDAVWAIFVSLAFSLFARF